MSYISSFSSLEDLSEYYTSKLYYSDPSVSHTVINRSETISMEDLANLYPDLSFTSKFLSCLNDNLNTNFVVYSMSKTSYKNLVHPFIVASFYKNYYDVLKKHKYIVEASAFTVILIDKPITQEVFDSIQSFHFDQLSLSTSLQNVLQVVDSYNLDTKYYQQQISFLQTQISDLKQKLADSERNLYNKTISTWY